LALFRQDTHSCPWTLEIGTHPYPTEKKEPSHTPTHQSNWQFKTLKKFLKSTAQAYTLSCS
jgi:hypothetical protein